MVAYRLDAAMPFRKGAVFLFLLAAVSCTADNARRRSLLELHYGICSNDKLCRTTAENEATWDKR